MSVKARHSLTALFMAVVLLFSFFQLRTRAFEVTELSSKGIVVTENSDLNMRSGPGTDYDKIGSVAKDTVVFITGSALDKDESEWFRISANGYTGFVMAKYIKVFDAEYTPNEEFELMISQFPESYKESLRILHALHPSWKFSPLMTGLTWETLMENESVTGRNLLQSPDAWKSFEKGAYDWENNEWYSFDSGAWQQACLEVIAYYLDPRNFLDGNVYQFLVLSDDGSEVDPDVINGIFKGTFMHDKNIGTEEEPLTYGEAIIKAAKESGASPYMLAARIRLEQGAVGNKLAHGTVSGYEGYYNHFDIGAYRHSNRSAMENGAIYAKARDWDTPYKAILGGANFLVKNYIKVGQNTLYLQKYDVVDGGNGLYGHQYMTNVRAAADECASLRNAIQGTAAEESALNFLIPVYEDMPETPQTLPLTTGSSNNLLASLEVEGHEIEFNRYTNEYELFMEENELTVSATALHKDATVEGTGKVYLRHGINAVTVTVTASNTNKRTYTVYVTCSGEDSPLAPTPTPTPSPTPTPTATVTGAPGEATTPPATPTPTPKPTFNTEHTLKDDVAVDIKIGTTLTEFKKKLSYTGYTVAFTDASGNTKTDTEIMKTGDAVIISYNGKVEKTVLVAVSGDANGDGKTSLVDLLKIQRHILEIQALDSAYFKGGDLNGDGKLSLADLLLCQKRILEA